MEHGIKYSFHSSNVLGEPGGRIVEFYKSRKDQLGLSLTVGPNSALSISYIQPGSAAGKAPLRIGDRVLTINGTAIQNLNDAQVCRMYDLFGNLFESEFLFIVDVNFYLFINAHKSD